MFRLPTRTILGSLEIAEVYEFYDFPRLFSARSLSDCEYIALSVEDHADSLVWLYVAISRERLRQIEKGLLEVRTAFAYPEDGQVFRVSTSVDDEMDVVELLEASQVDGNLLPLSGETLLPVDTVGELEPASRVAAQTRRETLRFALRFRDMPFLEAPSRVIGQALSGVQELVFALAQAIDGTATTRGRIQPDILSASELRVVGFFPSSFGIELSAAEYSNLYGESSTANALEGMDSLLSAGSSEERLTPLLAELRPRVASKYRALVDLLIEAEVGIKVEWGSVDPGKGGTHELSLDEIRQISATISLVDTASEETYELSGTLIGINSRTGTFEIQESISGSRIAGRVDSALFPEDEEYTVNATYRATIRETTEVMGVSGEEKVSRSLIRLVAST